jgi:5'-deoxynucleotidase
MPSHFYAILSRMKNINRWGLMRNTRQENLSEHSLEVAFIAHCLALIGNKRLGKSFSSFQRIATRQTKLY